MYDAAGSLNAWYAQPLYWGLGFLGLSFITQTVSAIVRLSPNTGWFDTASGQQAPVLLVLLVVLAVVGLSRSSRH